MASYSLLERFFPIWIQRWTALPPPRLGGLVLILTLVTVPASGQTRDYAYVALSDSNAVSVVDTVLRQPKSRDGNDAATPWLTGPNNITMTLRIERSVRQGIMVFTLSGRMKAEEVAELKALFDADYRTIISDLRDVRLADREAVKFLRDCEADGMRLENCPAYVREWIEREKD